MVITLFSMLTRACGFPGQFCFCSRGKHWRIAQRQFSASRVLPLASFYLTVVLRIRAALQMLSALYRGVEHFDGDNRRYASVLLPRHHKITTVISDWVHGRRERREDHVRLEQFRSQRGCPRRRDIRHGRSDWQWAAVKHASAGKHGRADNRGR